MDNSVPTNGRPDHSPYLSSDPDDRIAADPIFEGDVDTDKTVVCGAGGFIGGHLVADLIRQDSNTVRAVDGRNLDEDFRRTGLRAAHGAVTS